MRPTATAATAIDVMDQGRLISFGLEDMMRYHGPGFPAVWRMPSR